jgi:uncharacterized protein YodC (DUF2158 family)
MIGTVVYLNSGSPALVVLNEDSSSGAYTVAWYDMGTVQKLTLPRACFQFAAPDPKHRHLTFVPSTSAT